MDYEFKHVPSAPYTASCELCHDSCTEFVDVAPYSVICMKCLDKLAKVKADIQKAKKK